MQKLDTKLEEEGRLSKAEFGSDVVVEVLRDLGVPFVSLNPGSSFRGIHDSLVNFPPQGSPEMVVCCHEEIAVAVAQGYARVKDAPMVAALHNVVGLAHASMAIYNAWCDRMPMIIIGGTGPNAGDERRPHIDWVHTALVQGNLVRDYVKWDDQPASVSSFPESLLRAYRIAMTEPKGPVYVCFDVSLQEKQVTDPLTLPDATRFGPPAPQGADPDALRRAAELVAGASWPVIVVDEVGRHKDALPALRELAELLGAPVVSVGAYFNLPTDHPLNLSLARREALEQADVLLALDVFDLDAALSPGVGSQRANRHMTPRGAKTIHITLHDLLQHSWVQDQGRMVPVDVPIAADLRLALPSLVEVCRDALGRDRGSGRRVEQRREAVRRLHDEARQRVLATSERNWNAGPVSNDRLHGELAEVTKGVPWSVVHSGYARAWNSAWEFSEPDQMAGGDRGGGLGYGPGASVGASLAYRDAERLCVSIMGDGDFLMTPSALWTASNLRLPLLMVVANNRSYGNDEGHQEHMARLRGRPVENRGVGIYIDEPKTDFATLAKAFDVEGFGPVEDPEALRGVLERAASIVTRERRPVLVDVVTQRGR